MSRPAGVIAETGVANSKPAPSLLDDMALLLRTIEPWVADYHTGSAYHARRLRELLARYDAFKAVRS